MKYIQRFIKRFRNSISEAIKGFADGMIYGNQVNSVGGGVYVEGLL